MKKCTKCGVEKPTDEFYRDRGAKSGRRADCKQCNESRHAKWLASNSARHNASTRTWQKANPEKASAYAARWRKANREKARGYTRKWRLANPEKMSASAAMSREKNLAKFKARNTQRRLENLAKFRAREKQWVKSHRAQVNAKHARHTAQKLAATPAWANQSCILRVYREALFFTERDGTPWHVDHIVPLQSFLVCGLHCEDNLQVLPGIENMSKGNRYWPDMPRAESTGLAP